MDKDPERTPALDVSEYLVDRDGQPVTLLGSMPDLVNSEPAAVFKCDIYLLLLLRNPKTIVHARTGRPGVISYQFSLAVLDTVKKRLDWFIGIEESTMGTRMLGVFDCSECAHSNLGEIGPATQAEFLELAAKIFRQRTGCAAILRQAI